MTDGLTNTIIDTATALSAAHTKGQFSIHSFKKGLEAKEQAALQLLQSAAQAAPAPAGDRGQLLDVMA